MIDNAAPLQLRVKASPILAATIGAMLSLAPVPVTANGFGESSPWQFATPAERQTNAQIADMIARRNGGYYDGFQTVVSNVTNIGAQVNCNNVADATANRATNNQDANSPDVQLASDINSDATANENAAAPNGDGQTANDQSNAGAIDSTVSNSDGSVTSGEITTGDSNQDILNDQVNSGNQSAQINGSTACDFNDAPVSGYVNLNGTSVGGTPLN